MMGRPLWIVVRRITYGGFSPATRYRVRCRPVPNPGSLTLDVWAVKALLRVFQI